MEEQAQAADGALDGALLATAFASRLLQRSLAQRYCEIMRKPPAARTVDDLVCLSAWAKQIQFKDEEVKKHVRFDLLCQVMRLQPVECDQLVCQQGEEGDAFYVVFEGNVSIYVEMGEEGEGGAAGNTRPGSHTPPAPDAAHRRGPLTWAPPPHPHPIPTPSLLTPHPPAPRSCSQEAQRPKPGGESARETAPGREAAHCA